MICRDGKWVIEKVRAEPAPKPKRRLVTPAMQAAARANGSKSQGVKHLSPEDKERIALNATRHAQTSTKLVFLEDESPEDFEAEVARWARQLGAKAEPEVAQVRTAVYNDWKARRANAAEVSAVNRTQNEIVDGFYDTMEGQVRELAANLAKQPGDSVAGLMQSTMGCSYLIDQFTIIKDWLSEFESFEVSMREHAIRLGGHDPKALFHNPVVMSLNRAYLAGTQGAVAGSYTAADAADALVFDRAEGVSVEEYERRLGWIIEDLPTPEEGCATLCEYVEKNLAILTDRRELIALREERNLADALGEARSTVTAAGERRHRYAGQGTRLSQASIRLMFTMQHERRKYGEGDLEGLGQVDGPAALAAAAVSETRPDTGAVAVPDEPSAASEAVAEAPQTTAGPAEEGECKNEPQSTQVVGGMVNQDAALARPAAAGDTQVPLSESDHEASPAVYRQTLKWVETKPDGDQDAASARPAAAGDSHVPLREAASTTVAEAPPAGAAGAEERECKNEPQSTEVVGGVGNSNTHSGLAAGTSMVPAEDAGDALDRLIAEGRKEFADLRQQYDHLL